MKFTQVDPQIVIGHATAAFSGRDRDQDVTYRIDSRGGEVRVDLKGGFGGPWEAVDEGQPFDTVDEGKAFAIKHCAAIVEQATFSPRGLR